MKIPAIPMFFAPSGSLLKGQMDSAVRISRENGEYAYCTGCSEDTLICMQIPKDSENPVRFFHDYLFSVTEEIVEIDADKYKKVSIVRSRHIQIPEWMRIKKLISLLNTVSGDIHGEILGAEGLHSAKRLQSVCNPCFPQILP